jgi:hypothetical protein
MPDKLFFHFFKNILNGGAWTFVAASLVSCPSIGFGSRCLVKNSIFFDRLETSSKGAKKRPKNEGP